MEVGRASCTSIVKIPQGFVTLSRGESVKIWDQKWSLSLTIPIDYEGFSGVDLWGSDLLIPASEGKILIVNTLGETLNSLAPQTDGKIGELMCLKYLKSRDVIVAGFESKVIAVVSREGKTLCRVNVEDEPICLGVCESEVIVGTTGQFITKLTWENDSLKVACSTRLTNPGISGVAVRSDSKICVTACWDRKVRYFSVKKLKLLAALDLSVPPECVSFGLVQTRGAGLVYVGDGDGRVTIWDLYADKM